MKTPIHYEQALWTVRNHLKEEQEKYGGCDVDVVEEQTVVKAFGWIFYFSSSDFIRTRDPKYSLGGNGPIVVRRDTGEIFQHHPSQRLEEIDRYHMRKGVRITAAGWERAWRRQLKENAKRSRWRFQLEEKNRKQAQAGIVTTGSGPTSGDPNPQ